MFIYLYLIRAKQLNTLKHASLFGLFIKNEIHLARAIRIKLESIQEFIQL